MKTEYVAQGTITPLDQDFYLLTWVQAFLVDRKAQNLSRGTLDFYRKKLGLFTDFCETQVITAINQITPNVIREYLLYLEEKGHNPGGIHACYRALKTFLYWWENETEPDGWKNPIRKVKPPKNPSNLLDPVELADVSTLLETCGKNKFTGERDRAILLCLLDTGARAQEFLDVDLSEVNQVSGSVFIRQGKGRKPRTVFLGTKARKALRSYLKTRKDNCPALWVTDEGQRLSYWGLRGIIDRHSEAAGIKPPTLHSFRRAFALNMLRAGVDIYSLQHLMGHADLQVLRCYLKQSENDLKMAHAKGSPVDRGLGR